MFYIMIAQAGRMHFFLLPFLERGVLGGTWIFWVQCGNKWQTLKKQRLETNDCDLGLFMCLFLLSRCLDCLPLLDDFPD